MAPKSKEPKPPNPYSLPSLPGETGKRVSMTDKLDRLKTDRTGRMQVIVQLAKDRKRSKGFRFHAPKTQRRQDSHLQMYTNFLCVMNENQESVSFSEFRAQPTTSHFRTALPRLLLEWLLTFAFMHHRTSITIPSKNFASLQITSASCTTICVIFSHMSTQKQPHGHGLLATTSPTVLWLTIATL